MNDLSALSALTNLKKLHIRGTTVSDLSALKSLTNLKAFDLFRTKVSPDQVDALKTASPQLRIHRP